MKEDIRIYKNQIAGLKANCNEITAKICFAGLPDEEKVIDAHNVCINLIKTIKLKTSRFIIILASIIKNKWQNPKKPER